MYPLFDCVERLASVLASDVTDAVLPMAAAVAAAMPEFSMFTLALALGQVRETSEK